MRTAGLGRQRRLPARLPGHDLGDGVPDDDAGLLDLLLRQSGRDTNLEGRLDVYVLGSDAANHRLALQPRYEHPIGKTPRICK